MPENAQTPTSQVHHERAGLIFHARTSPCSEMRREKGVVFSKKKRIFTFSRLRSEDALLGGFLFRETRLCLGPNKNMPQDLVKYNRGIVEL